MGKSLSAFVHSFSCSIRCLFPYFCPTFLGPTRPRSLMSTMRSPTWPTPSESLTSYRPPHHPDRRELRIRWMSDFESCSRLTSRMSVYLLLRETWFLLNGWKDLYTYDVTETYLEQILYKENFPIIIMLRSIWAPWLVENILSSQSERSKWMQHILMLKIIFIRSASDFVRFKLNHFTSLPKWLICLIDRVMGH